MPLILVTGMSTSGKSTVAKELSRRGYKAYDTEHNGISAWYNKKTGKRVAELGAIPERTEGWLNRHEWLISTDWVKKISEQAKSKPIFLCGGAANEAEIREVCSAVIWLKTNEATIKKRVHIARDHDYGTKSHELASIIAANKQKEAEYQKIGAIMVNTNQPIEDVVNEILIKTGVAK